MKVIEEETVLAALRRDLLQAMTMLEREGIIDFNGHFSARLPDGRGLLINAADSVRSRLRPEDFIAIDFEGRPLEGTRGPPMEFHIHAQIYHARPDAQAVVHTHPCWSTVLTTVGQGFAPVTMQAAVLGAVPTFPKTASINTAELGRELAASLGDSSAALLKAHGAVVAAASVEGAFVRAVYLEENAHRHYLALQIGEPQVLDAEECAVISRNLSRPHLLRKVWDYYHGKYFG
ncbi:MAG: class aldolase/adducin family protein [Nevskia sp.]|nr:class aldolase/adducin family protein [Nevskia sp.]